LWWAALALLLLNDHALKGAGLLPAAITGKLSDFAGMVVAPPLAALVLGAGSPARRVVAAALVALGLVLIKLWPDAARALEHALALLGVPSRIWVDASDLFALAALPLGYALSAPPATARRADSASWLQRGGVALAALACIATTGGGEKKSTGGSSDVPQIENATGESLTVIVASTEGAGGCALYRDDRVALLTADAFVAARELVLEDEARATLTASHQTARCGAATVHLPDGDRVVVFWRDLEAIESFAPADDERWVARRVVVSGGSGHFDVEVGDDLSTLEVGGDLPEPDCPEPEVTHSLEFTALAEAHGFFEIGELREADDGCLEVDWFAIEGDTSPDTQRLCVPGWSFPFEAGETLSVVQEIDPLGPRVLRVARHDGDEVDTQLVVWNDAIELDGSRVSELRAIDCIGSLSSCGAYVRPLEVDVRGRDAPLQSGEEATIEASEPKETRILVGAARDVAWSGAACDGAEARTGATVNLLELRSY
jgi:hypothetical protein